MFFTLFPMIKETRHMAHHFQFLDAQGKPLSPARLDDDICRHVLKIEPDPKQFSTEFVLLATALMHDIQPLALLGNIRRVFSDEHAKHRDTFATVLGYVISRGITARTWTSFEFASPN
jgi:hypothetical protein